MKSRLLFVVLAVVMMGFVVLGLTFIAARRYARPSLAWMAPVALAALPVFKFGLYELQGYMFFALFSILAAALCADTSLLRADTIIRGEAHQTPAAS